MIEPSQRANATLEGIQVCYIRTQELYSLIRDTQLIGLVFKAATDLSHFTAISREATLKERGCCAHLKEPLLDLAGRLVATWKCYRETDFYMDREDIDQFLFTCFKWYLLPSK